MSTSLEHNLYLSVLKYYQASFEMRATFYLTFKNARAFEDLRKGWSHLIFDDSFYIAKVEFRMQRHKLVGPIHNYLCTRPVPSPPMSLVMSEMPTRLKSPMTLCLRQLAATANSSADCLSS